MAVKNQRKPSPTHATDLPGITYKSAYLSNNSLRVEIDGFDDEVTVVLNDKVQGYFRLGIDDQQQILDLGGEIITNEVNILIVSQVNYGNEPNETKLLGKVIVSGVEFNFGDLPITARPGLFTQKIFVLQTLL